MEATYSFDQRAENKRRKHLVNCLMALHFTVSSAVHAWEFLYDLSATGGSYQLH
jgi:hypothetical protein